MKKIDGRHNKARRLINAGNPCLWFLIKDKRVFDVELYSGKTGVNDLKDALEQRLKECECIIAIADQSQEDDNCIFLNANTGEERGVNEALLPKIHALASEALKSKVK